ncbi:MAG: helix-turn-helix domain-containing protein [Bacteroidales bacterium]|nr:helix-turn-helix domain-containing protein [Bacteroidales bacterium]
MDTRVRETIGRRIRELREEAKMSQNDVAKDLNISQAAVAQYENGKNFPDEEKLIYFARTFNCTLDYIFGLTDIKRRKETTVMPHTEGMEEVAKRVFIEMMKGKIPFEYEVREMGQEAVYPGTEPQKDKK